jgi:hypothetical protein
MATRDRTRFRGRERDLGTYSGDRPAPDEVPLSTAYPPAASTSWRDEVAGASGLNVIAGIWLIISPWVLGYTGPDAMWNPIVFGAIVGILALARAAGAYRAVGLSMLNMAIGVWLFISAFWLAQSSQASWNVGVMGVVVFVLAAWSVAATREPATLPPR